jgi:large subunit ribosomal protein L4e
MENADLARIINSNEVQSVVRPKQSNLVAHEVQKKNPLKNRKLMDRLNPNAAVVRLAAQKANEANREKRQKDLAAKRGCSKSLTKE